MFSLGRSHLLKMNKNQITDLHVTLDQVKIIIFLPEIIKSAWLSPPLVALYSHSNFLGEASTVHGSIM